MSALRRLLAGWPGWILRLAVSVTLVWWLVRHLRGEWEAIGAVDPVQLAPAALVFAVSTVLGGLQWSLILRHAGVAVGTARLQQLYWVGLFFNNFLPSSVGGDLVKVADVAVSTGQLTRTVAGTLLDRMLGLSALVGLAFVAGAILGGAAPAGLPWWLLAGLALPTVGLSLGLLSGRLARLLVATARRLASAGVAERLAGVVLELRAYRSAPLFVVGLAGLALLVQALRVGTHVLVAHAMGLPLDVATVLAFYVLVPVLGVAVMLPISFNGLGVREFVATRLMPEIGILPRSAFALQITTYLVQVAVSLVGGLLFAWLLLRGRLVLRSSERSPHRPDREARETKD